MTLRHLGLLASAVLFMVGAYQFEAGTVPRSVLIFGSVVAMGAVVIGIEESKMKEDPDE